jgi:putative glycosyltransferase
MLVHLVTAFSDRPLHYIAYLGLFILTVSLLYTAYLVAMFLAYRTVPAGYTSLAVSVWILGG